MGRITEITEEDLDFMLTCFDDIFADMDEILRGDEPVLYFDKEFRLCIFSGDSLPPLEADVSGWEGWDV